MRLVFCLYINETFCCITDFSQKGLLLGNLGVVSSQHGISSYSSVPAVEPKADNTDNSKTHAIEPLTRYTIADAAAKAGPAVVHITVTLGLNFLDAYSTDYFNLNYFLLESCLALCGRSF